MRYRDEEISGEYFRAERFFCIWGQWFFATRECLQLGPYETLDEAEMALTYHLRHVNEGGIYADAGLYSNSNSDNTLGTPAHRRIF